MAHNLSRQPAYRHLAVPILSLLISQHPGALAQATDWVVVKDEGTEKLRFVDKIRLHEKSDGVVEFEIRQLMYSQSTAAPKTLTGSGYAYLDCGTGSIVNQYGLLLKKKGVFWEHQPGAGRIIRSKEYSKAYSLWC